MIEAEYDLAKTIVIEEAGELIQVLCKIDRFGFDNHNPYTGDENPTLLAEEIGDLQGAIDWLIHEARTMLDDQSKLAWDQIIFERRKTKRTKAMNLNKGILNVPLPGTPT
jgi:hypothetical protein